MKSFLLLIAPIVVMLISCTPDEDYDISNDSLIIEGWIEDDNYPVVIVTQSIPVSQSFISIDSVSNYLVRWAKVCIYDGTDSVILTGKYDSGYFPPYIYTTSRMKGGAGKTYHLTVDYKNHHATATTTVPSPPPAVEFRVDPCIDSDSLYQIIAHFCDYRFQKNYYQFFTRIGTEKKQFLASYMGSIDDAILGEETTIQIYRGHQMMTHDYTPYFHLYDSVTVKFAQIDETTYHFWDDYTKILSLSSNMFLSSFINIRSNIEGGFGYWCGYGSVVRNITIADSVSHQ